MRCSGSRWPLRRDAPNSSARPRRPHFDLFSFFSFLSLPPRGLAAPSCVVSRLTRGLASPSLLLFFRALVAPPPLGLLGPPRGLEGPRGLLFPPLLSFLLFLSFFSFLKPSMSSQSANFRRQVRGEYSSSSPNSSITSPCSLSSSRSTGICNVVNFRKASRSRRSDSSVNSAAVFLTQPISRLERSSQPAMRKRSSSSSTAIGAAFSSPT
mmetsp:Transcript_101905/g.283864  ORF Transcript_101905/g.283864 Transcript_101905/m.283864 type:complete len:210 (+) Transcript_101905:186-815(+)